ncbi:MAG: magnesium transporter [Spirochaetales bacterium]|nr:magnesium transporter [Spirochaetales bacterium]
MRAFLENMREYMRDMNDEQLKQLVAEVPMDELLEVWDSLDEEEELKIFSLLDLEQKVDLITSIPVSSQEALLESLTGDSAKALLAEMDPDDLADFIQSVSPEVRDAVWNNLGEEARKEAQFLLKYDYDDAAGLMTTRYLAVRPNLKVATALRWARRSAREVETVYSIYVLDPLKRLLGVVSLRDLLAADDDALVQDVMEKKVVTVDQDTDQEEAARILETYDLIALPVVDHYHRLLGIITFDDIIDVIREEQSEDVYRMSAVGASRTPYLESSLWALVRRRIPWLVVLLLAATLTTNVIAAYRSVLEAAVVLAFFIPIVTGTGGNSGTQSATLMIRGLATGELHFYDAGRIVLKELAVGLMIGLGLGVLTILRAMFLPPAVPLAEALAVGTAMCFVVVVATIVGSLAPLAIARLGLDPAVMAGPLMATLIDVSGLTIYFQTAKLLLHLA